jgi:hypothetical protein
LIIAQSTYLFSGDNTNPGKRTHKLGDIDLLNTIAFKVWTEAGTELKRLKLTETEKQQRQDLKKYYPVIRKAIKLSENVKNYKVEVILSEPGKLAEKTIFVHEIEN